MAIPSFVIVEALYPGLTQLDFTDRTRSSRVFRVSRRSSPPSLAAWSKATAA